MFYVVNENGYFVNSNSNELTPHIEEAVHFASKEAAEDEAEVMGIAFPNKGPFIVIE